MKTKKNKAGIIIFILILAAGAAGGIGLVDLVIPAGSWGVIETKLDGVDPTPINGSKWNWIWRWERLLPTVMKIHKFRIQTYDTVVINPVKGQIFPSGKDYGTALDGNPDFTFELSYYIKYSVYPGSLPQLVEEGVTAENIGNWSIKIGETLGKKVSRMIIADPTLLYTEDLGETIQPQISDDPQLMTIKVERLIPTNIKLPDYDLYLTAKKIYLERQDEKLKIELEELRREHEKNMAALDKEIEILNNIDAYGEMLTQFPILLDLLYMRRTDKDGHIRFYQQNRGD